ncbi:MAG: hypothetical protein DDT30_01423 [Dehalococcoidia bacterium]|nr:hypothetical protein [Bacillota bacterium]
MGILSLKTGDRVLRVREEDFGCAIFSNNRYAEGDKMTFEVLKTLSESEAELSKTIQTLSCKYKVAEKQIVIDLIEMFEEFNREGWFIEIYEQLISWRNKNALSEPNTH